tara:strand:+ start:72 stop:557 length:486 start_codon:yes stop_codon:yes gene_type:complete
MAIKLLCLKSGERIVADVENAIIKDKPYGYLLTRPCLVFVGQETDELDTLSFGPGVDEELGEELSDEELRELQEDDTSLEEEEYGYESQQRLGGVEINLSPWMPLSEDDTIPIPFDVVMTLVEPVEALKNMFKKDILEYEEQEDGSENAGTDEPIGFGGTD